MNEQNVLNSETSEKRGDSIYTPDNNNVNKKPEVEKEQFYLIQENKELKENNIKLTNKLEELESKLKQKNIEVFKYFKKERGT